MRQKIILTALLSLLTATCGAVEPFKKTGTLGLNLEKIFKKSMKSCDITELKAKSGMLGSLQPVSAIPKSLQESLDMDARFIWQETNSLARMFSFIYNDESSYNIDMAPGWLLIDDILPNSAATLQPNGASRVGFNFDCAATIAAAISANSQLEFPPATASLALSAKYSGQKKSTLTLASGTFESPLVKLIDPIGSDENQLAGLLYLYNWYRTHLSKPNTYKLIESIKGVAVIELLKVTESMDGKTDAKVGLHFPLFDMNASLATAKETSLGLSVEGYYVGTELNAAGKPKVTWRFLDDAKTVATKAENFSAQFDPSSENSPLPGMTTAHRQVLRGVPRKFCNDSIWIVETKDASKPVALKSVKPIGDSALLCEFTVAYAVPADTPDTVKLQYNFKTKSRMHGEVSGEFIEFIIPAADVNVSINRDPIVVATQADARPAVSGDWLTWNVQFFVQDSSAVSNLSDLPSVNSATINCADNKILKPSPADLDLRVSQKNGTFNLKYLRDPALQGKDTLSTDFIRCGANVEMAFKSSKPGGSAITKHLNVQLYVPKSSLESMPATVASAGE